MSEKEKMACLAKGAHISSAVNYMFGILTRSKPTNMKEVIDTTRNITTQAAELERVIVAARGESCLSEDITRTMINALNKIEINLKDGDIEAVKTNIMEINAMVNKASEESGYSKTAGFVVLK